MDVREKLVELVGQVQDCGCDVTNVVEMKYVENITLVDYLLANGVTVQEWISVKDGLPEDDERIEFYDDGRIRLTTVLTYTEYGRIIPKNRLIVRPTGNEYFDEQVTDGWIWAIGTEEVTHWMPLPHPPKGE